MLKLDQTLQSYQDNAIEYISKVRVRSKRDQLYWPGIQLFLNYLNKSEPIFEVGSGSGLDAENIEKLGYTVVRSDATPAFIDGLRKRGHKVIDYNVLFGPTQKQYKGILANAVLLHFTDDQLKSALKNLYDSLLPGGYICIGMKLGDFEGWRTAGLGDRRYFKYWHSSDLTQVLESIGFKLANQYVCNNSTYIVITCRK